MYMLEIRHAIKSNHKLSQYGNYRVTIRSPVLGTF
jgi:hypothetical protein